VFALAGALCGRSPLLPFVGAFHSPEAPLAEIIQNKQRRFLKPRPDRLSQPGPTSVPPGWPLRACTHKCDCSAIAGCCNYAHGVSVLSFSFSRFLNELHLGIARRS
jgi:hypothetical protein